LASEVLKKGKVDQGSRVLEHLVASSEQLDSPLVISLLTCRYAFLEERSRFDLLRRLRPRWSRDTDHQDRENRPHGISPKDLTGAF
jgi:hypothetical protein